MDWYEAEVRGLEQATAASPSQSVVFYGSSSIRLWTTLTEDFNGLPVVNRGFGGSTLEACSWFFYRLIVPLRPSALVLYAGDNDLGDGKSADQVLASYRALSEQLRNHLGPIPFTFLSIKPSPARVALTDKIRQTNEMLRREHALFASNNYVDVFSLMLGPDGQPRNELYAPDGLHLSQEGYALWTRALTPCRPLWLPPASRPDC